MHRSLESLLISVVGTAPALVMLVMFFNDQSHSLKGFSFLVVFAVLCACVSILMARVRLLGHQASEVQTQTEDVESNLEESDVREDAPPIYEVVVTKPPPYECLYVSSQASSREKDDAEAGQPKSDGSTDSDLPTYSQAAQAPMPV